ncbi:hypothetical protein AWC38_SpisGene23924 [Stylophora pistillata]|uniref:Uncharacterized protein n=1 Tax=Stylophora pistillata TaxID=50429 RepID=A0A2B4R7F7_STYPI|nr:hypothetical protein AWC38_SpisGene23924 [Stylophora pistillata]
MPDRCFRMLIRGSSGSGTAAVNLNKLNSELQTKADLSVVTNGLNAKLDTTTFNTEIAKNPATSTVMLLDGTHSMTGDLDLNNNKVINSAAPTAGTDLCNKTYVDIELAKKHDIGSIDLTNYLDKTKGGNIEAALNFTSIHGAQRQINGFSNQSAQTSSAVNQYYVDNELRKKADQSVMPNELSEKLDISTFNTEIVKKANLSAMTNQLSGKLHTTTFDTEIAKKAGPLSVMLLDGTRAMTSDLNMNSKAIINLKDPQAHDSHNAATVNYTNKTISDNNAVIKTNYEKYVNDNLTHSISEGLVEEAKKLISNFSNSYNDLAYIMISPGQFTDEDDITGKQFTGKYGTRVKPFELKLDTKKGYY